MRKTHPVTGCAFHNMTVFWSNPGSNFVLALLRSLGQVVWCCIYIVCFLLRMSACHGRCVESDVAVFILHAYVSHVAPRLFVMSRCEYKRHGMLAFYLTNTVHWWHWRRYPVFRTF